MLGRRLSPSTLKAYVAAIAPHHDAVIVRFLRGGGRLNPPRSHLIPSWDLSVVLAGLQGAPKVSQDFTSGPAHLNQEGGGPVPTTPFRDQAMNLQVLPSEEADPALALLCPDSRKSPVLAVSKQRMAHWLVDAITLAYQVQGEACPLGVRAHSTRSVASSWALTCGTAP
ncbi:Iron uptake protein A1 [Labeo rohita]|uniref:Iron uptake protein A1 n=1 Tax=Labeo rohita TaxID=84645 RepID=A0ABQ8M1X2_LABRO|nr:Iron uptake protein A1 [Labeo rohita]